MPLQSDLFRGDRRLEDCLVNDSAHITEGTVGPFVGKIHQALGMLMDDAAIDPAEVSAKRYGRTTANTVLKYKTERSIINTAYQHTADNIVGKMTIHRMDLELLDLQTADPFDAATAGIDVVKVGAVAGFAVIASEHIAVTHLTRGFNNTGRFEPGPAWTAIGHVKLTQAGVSLDDWEFGFVQFMKINRVEMIYAGRTRAEGSIQLRADLPPALRQRLFLDSRSDGRSPWTRQANGRFDVFEDESNAATGDHPVMKAPLQITNRKTNQRNLLFEMTDEREFWTVFSGLFKGVSFHQLAHFHWSIKVRGRVSWTGDNPAGRKQSDSLLTFDAVLKGAPSEPLLKPFLLRPHPPQGNEAGVKALQASALGGPPNRVDHPDWFDNFEGFAR